MISKRYIGGLGMLLLLLGLTLGGCGRMLFDDLGGCPQVVRLHLTYEDACGTPVPDRYAPLAKGKALKVFAFREDGTRLPLQVQPEIAFPLGSESYYDVTLWEYGRITFVTLLAEELKLYGLEQAEPTRLDELLALLQKQEHYPADLPELWYGIHTTYDNRAYEQLGTHTDTLEVGMQERLHTLNFSIKGIPAGTYTLQLTTPENGFHANGTPATQERTYQHTFEVAEGERGGSLSFDLMRLYPERAKEVQLALLDAAGQVKYSTTFGEYFGLDKNARLNLCERNIDIAIELQNWVLFAAYIQQWNLVWRRVNL